MHCFSVFAALFTLAAPVISAEPPSESLAGIPISIAWGSNYGDPSTSTQSVACSTGLNGLITKGYKKLGDLPSFPYVAAVEPITAWNDPDCGKCFQASWNETGASVYVTGVDVSGGGFVMSKQAMDKITRNLAGELGRIRGEYVPVNQSFCGL